MTIRALWILVLAAALAACAEKEAPAPEAAEPEAMPATEPVAEQAPAEAPAPTADVNAAFIAHMHQHAEQLDTLNFALADGDLAAAQGAAYWLSRHDTVEGIPTEWAGFIVGMRQAAIEVEAAADIDAARAAAEGISTQCQGCHTAAGI